MTKAANNTVKRGRPTFDIELAPHVRLHASADGIRFAFTASGPKSVENRTAVFDVTIADLAELLPRIEKAGKISIDLAKLASIEI